jgi:hypothetical protein
MPQSNIKINNGVFNDYTITPANLTQYKAFRGVTDFSQIGQFNQFESGYQFLSVISMPKFMTMLGQNNSVIDQMNDNFKHTLEYEFRGLDGLPDIQADTLSITDGINEQRMINKVTSDTSTTVSMSYFEKSGGLLTRYAEYYLTGIKDRMTQAKTYHGLIENGLMRPSYENETFTLLYYVTDSTMLRLERAVLLVNAQLNKAETSMYNGSRDNISNKELSIEFNCFPIWGTEVDKAANYLLKEITGVKVTASNGDRNLTYAVENSNPEATLDSSDYRYGVLGGQNYDPTNSENPNLSPSAIQELYQAIDNLDSETHNANSQ